MKLWLISQSVNSGYGTYDAAVVAANSEADARAMKIGSDGTWASPEHVSAEYLGEAASNMSIGVVLASFNAG